MAEPVSCICGYCAATFTRPAAWVRRGGGHYCSNSCRNRARARGLAVRFWTFVERADGCWLWRGAVGTNGYGKFRGQSGPNGIAHRIAWELTHGPIPAGQSVLHRCDVRHCVRPDHLFLGDHAANMADMRAKGRQVRGERVQGAKLNLAAADAIRAAYAAGASTHAALAAAFGVSATTVGAVVNGQRWLARGRAR